MQFVEIDAVMQAAGYRWNPKPDAVFDLGYWWRRIETSRPCSQNGRDQIVVELFDMGKLVSRQVADADRYSVTAKVTGAVVLRDGLEVWCSCEAYSMPALQFLGDRQLVEQAIVRAWEALAEVRRVVG